MNKTLFFVGGIILTNFILFYYFAQDDWVSWVHCMLGKIRQVWQVGPKQSILKRMTGKKNGQKQ